MSMKKTEAETKVEGEIYSWTEISRNGAPSDFQFCAPYIELLVKLDEGPMVTAMMTDVPVNVKKGKLRLPKIGQRVELVTRKLHDGNDERNLIYYGYKARRPVPKATAKQIDRIKKTIESFWEPKLIKRSLHE